MYAQSVYKTQMFPKSTEIFLEILQNNMQHEEIQDIYVNALNSAIQTLDLSLINKVLVL